MFKKDDTLIVVLVLTVILITIVGFFALQQANFKIENQNLRRAYYNVKNQILIKQEIKDNNVSCDCENINNKIENCLEKYPKVNFGDCTPGEVVDGWSEVVIYSNGFDTTGLVGAVDMFVPREVRNIGIASYGTSPSSCETTWSIKDGGEYRRVNQEKFCEFIVNYDIFCDDCLLEWQGGCC
jgi:hypothetical protein